MANIRTYDAAKTEIRPDEKGFAAFETAGRRLHVYYDAAAQDYREIGRLQQQEIEGRKWPFDILALQNEGRGGFQVKGDRTSRGGGGGGSRGYRGLNQIAGGAGALGSYLAGTAPGNSDGGELAQVGGDTMRGRQTFAGTSDPARLIDVGAATGNYGGGSDNPAQDTSSSFDVAGSSGGSEYGGGSDSGSIDGPSWLGRWLGRGGDSSQPNNPAIPDPNASGDVFGGNGQWAPTDSSPDTGAQPAGFVPLDSTDAGTPLPPAGQWSPLGSGG